MKREILFRGKRVFDNKFEYGYLLWHCLGSEMNSFINNKVVINETVCQFTGIMDISGEKLFEGDIYNMGDDNIRYVVVWRKCMFIGKQIGSNSYARLDYFESEIKKVGNIYDNKELLK